MGSFSIPLREPFFPEEISGVLTDIAVVATTTPSMVTSTLFIPSFSVSIFFPGKKCQDLLPLLRLEGLGSFLAWLTMPIDSVGPRNSPNRAVHCRNSIQHRDSRDNSTVWVEERPTAELRKRHITAPAAADVVTPADILAAIEND